MVDGVVVREPEVGHVRLLHHPEEVDDLRQVIGWERAELVIVLPESLAGKKSARSLELFDLAAYFLLEPSGIGLKLPSMMLWMNHTSPTARCVASSQAGRDFFVRPVVAPLVRSIPQHL